VDLRFMMDHRRVLIANLSKGKLGEDKANLLGSLLVAWFQLAAHFADARQRYWGVARGVTSNFRHARA